MYLISYSVLRIAGNAFSTLTSCPTDLENRNTFVMNIGKCLDATLYLDMKVPCCSLKFTLFSSTFIYNFQHTHVPADEI